MDEDLNEPVKITMSLAEALVLFELTARVRQAGQQIWLGADEVQALWNLNCYFEKELAVPFSPAYGEVLFRARERLANETGLNGETPAQGK